MKRTNQKKKNKGFTLVELIAVLSILAVIMVLVLPKGNKQIDNSKKVAIRAEAKAYVDVATTLKMEGKLANDKDVLEVTIADIHTALNTEALQKEYFQTMPKRIRNIAPYNTYTMEYYQRLSEADFSKIELNGEYLSKLLD